MGNKTIYNFIVGIFISTTTFPHWLEVYSKFTLLVIYSIIFKYSLMYAVPIVEEIRI